MTVLCGLGAVELEGVGGGRSGDVSVAVEAMASLRLLSPTRIIPDLEFLCVLLDRC